MPETPSTPTPPTRPERADRPAPQPREQPRQAADLSDVMANMEKVRAAQADGIPHSQVLADAGVQPAPVPVTVVESDEEPKPVVMAETAVPPGLTEQGWSPEVTARHPQLLTETMAELLAEMPAANEEPIDPNDAGALRRAQQAIGSVEADLDALRTHAAAINSQRLAEAMGNVRTASGALRAAVDEAKAALSQPKA